MNDDFVIADKLDAAGDDFYNSLMSLHEGLTETQSHALNARLVLMMANQIGDLKILEQILDQAAEFN